MKKTLALILSALMLVSVMAVSVFADDEPASTTILAFSIKNENIQGDRFDGNVKSETANEIAVRFATSEVLTGIYPYMAGSEKAEDGSDVVSSMDVKVYKWSNNYEETVSGTPVVTNEDLAFGGTGWLSWTKSILPAGTQLPAGEYLVVINDMKASWAICSYLQTPIVGAEKAMKTYVNGEVKLVGEGAYNKVSGVTTEFSADAYATLAWKLEFAGANDGLVKTDLSADVASPAPAGSGDDAGSSDEAGGSADTSDNALVASLAAVAVMGLAVTCVAKKKQH